MIVVDTSALVDSLTGPKRSAAQLRRFVSNGERLSLPTLVLYEWWRGPRIEEELVVQEALFPSDQAIPFDFPEARAAANLYQELRRPRGREMDLAIAACALIRDAEIWTLNREDFTDIPSVRLAGD